MTDIQGLDDSPSLKPLFLTAVKVIYSLLAPAFVCVVVVMCLGFYASGVDEDAHNGFEDNEVSSSSPTDASTSGADAAAENTLSFHPSSWHAVSNDSSPIDVTLHAQTAVSLTTGHTCAHTSCAFIGSDARVAVNLSTREN